MSCLLWQLAALIAMKWKNKFIFRVISGSFYCLQQTAERSNIIFYCVQSIIFYYKSRILICLLKRILEQHKIINVFLIDFHWNRQSQTDLHGTQTQKNVMHIKDHIIQCYKWFKNSLWVIRLLNFSLFYVKFCASRWKCRMFAIHWGSGQPSSVLICHTYRWGTASLFIVCK